jgi:hypothetical protein
MKSREFMTELMEQKYVAQFSSLKNELSKVPFFSFTTEGWSTKNRKKHFLRFYSFLSLIVKINLIIVLRFITY